MTAPPAGEEATLGAAALYEGAPCGLLVTRANGSIETVNRTLCEWLGFSVDQLAGKRRLQDLLTIGCKIFHQISRARLRVAEQGMSTPDERLEMKLRFLTRSIG